MKLTDRVFTRLEHLENIVTKHLEESGEIRTDLKWLKKAHWVQFTVFMGAVGTAVLTYIFKGH